MLAFTKKYPKKRAFITGAAMGLGLSFCKFLAKEGWTIGMSDINQEKLEEAEKEIENLGGKALIYILDVADRKRYKYVVDDYLEKIGGIDLLVNNAGVGDGAAFHEYSLENWDWMIGINQMGVLYGCHYFVPVMQKQKGGQIINIASAAGFANAPRMSPYNVTKAAVISLSESLYYELDPLGIGVSVVMPTFIRTDIMQFARGTDDAVRRGRKFLEKTKLGPNDAVLEMLTKAGKGKLHIVLPKEARQSHWMKRIFPRFFRKQLMKISKRQLAKKP